MEPLCKNCVHWQAPLQAGREDDSIWSLFGRCHEIEKDFDEDASESLDSVCHTDCPVPGIATGPDFGCVHFEPSNPVEFQAAREAAREAAEAAIIEEHKKFHSPDSRM